jgi:flavin-dependent dehydrogenase
MPPSEFLRADAGQRLWDAIVIGAGPAGSVAARGLAQLGLGVLLVDKSTFPRWKVCGSCLNPFTLGVLADAGLGSLPERCGAQPITRMRLAAWGRSGDIALPGWRVLSRERFDAALIEAAVRAGAVFRPRTQAALGPAGADWRTVRLNRDNEQVSCRARVVLAADGLASRLLAGETGWLVTTEKASRVGAGALASDQPSFYRSGTVYIAHGTEGYVGVVRLEDGRLNLAAALNVESLRTTHNPGIAVAQLLRDVGWPHVPELPKLAWRGTPPLTQLVTHAAGERVFALGDAAGYVEPFTGEGIGWAMASGSAAIPLAARAVHSWAPHLADAWAARQRRNAAHRQRLSRTMTWISHHPAIAQLLLSLVGTLPWLARPVVRQVRTRAPSVVSAKEQAHAR